MHFVSTKTKKYRRVLLFLCVLCLCFTACNSNVGENTPTETPIPTPTEEENMTVEHGLEGKTYFFLGSSVTFGSASNGKSFVDFR